MIVVFDLDGTLVDASRLHAKILKDVLDVDIDPKNVYDSNSLGFLVMENLPKKKWSSIKDVTRQHEAAMLEGVGMTEPMPGVYEMLQKLPYKKAILTSAGRRLADAMIKHCNLGGYFDAIVTKDDVSKSKPDSEGLFLVADELNDVKLIVVGNDDRDLLSAKKYGAPFIFFSPDGKRRTILADYFVSNLKELPALVESLV